MKEIEEIETKNGYPLIIDVMTFDSPKSLYWLKRRNRGL